jgi:putative tryptophan/tyrosine transport system substrate-binding protein
MADPVPLGIVDSLARPGGNITGVCTDAGPEVLGKRLELLREVVPGISSEASPQTDEACWVVAPVAGS